MQGMTLGHYKILRELGVGGMGEVYAAEDTKLHRRVALKILPQEMAADPERLERFEREAKAVAALDHPNIVTVHSLEEAAAAKGETLHFITMQLVEGRTLSELIGGRGLPLEGFLEIAIPMAEAIGVAHEHGIVHRDLKPSNIMVSDDGRVRVLDFGLAKLRDEPEADAAGAMHTEPATEQATGHAPLLTEEGKILGTVAYMSPEQAEGRPVDHRSDIFALGILMYEMLCGEKPFRGETKVSMISSIMKDTPSSITEINPQLPPQLGRIIKLCLEKDQELRLQSAKDLRNELQRLRSEMQTGELELPRPPTSGSWWRRSGPTSGAGRAATTGLDARGEAVPRPTSRGWRWMAAAALTAIVAALLAFPALREWASPPPLPDRRDVVVLGLEATGGDEETAAFAAGLQEVLAQRLSRLTDTLPLGVIPAARARRVSSLERADLEEGANLAIDGSIERTPAATRLGLRLRSVPDGELLRTLGVEVQLGDPLELTERAVSDAAGMLGFELGPAERRELTSFGTDVPAAYELYLQGLGHLHAEAPDSIDRAIAVLNQAATLDTRFAEVAAGLGRAYWRKYRDDGAEQWLERATEACERAVSIDDRVADGHRCLAAIYNGTERVSEAADELARAAYLEPTSDDAVFGLAEAQARLGRVEEAEQTYRGAIDLRPRYAAPYFELGVFYYFEGRLEDSAAMFEEAVARSPRHRSAHSSLGGVYTLLGRYEDGVEVLERALELEPSGAAYSNLATTYFVLRRFGDAIAAYQEAIRFEPDAWMSWGNLGDAYYWAPGEGDKAPDAYRRAVEIVEAHLEREPRDPDALSDLAKYQGLLGDRQSAVENLQRAIELAPRDAQILYHGMLIHLHFDEHDAALDYLERAVEAGFSLPWVRDTPELDALRESPRYRALIEARVP